MNIQTVDTTRTKTVFALSTFDGEIRVLIQEKVDIFDLETIRYRVCSELPDGTGTTGNWSWVGFRGAAVDAMATMQRLKTQHNYPAVASDGERILEFVIACIKAGGMVTEKDCTLGCCLRSTLEKAESFALQGQFYYASETMKVVTMLSEINRLRFEIFNSLGADHPAVVSLHSGFLKGILAVVVNPTEQDIRPAFSIKTALQLFFEEHGHELDGMS